MYVGMILSAMGVDFMPRIMTYIQNNAKVSDCINEQIELGVLIAGIGILASFVFAPVILNLFYSKEFETGTSIIRWQLIGVLFRVFGFSFGYVITAKRERIAIRNHPIAFFHIGIPITDWMYQMVRTGWIGNKLFHSLPALYLRRGDYLRQISRLPSFCLFITNHGHPVYFYLYRSPFKLSHNRSMDFLWNQLVSARHRSLLDT